MPHVRSPQVDSDLDDIWYYIATETGSADVADRVIDGIVQRFLLLAKYPPCSRLYGSYASSEKGAEWIRVKRSERTSSITGGRCAPSC